MHHSSDKHIMELTASPELTLAFLDYMAERDIGASFGRVFDKDAHTQKIFDLAYKQWGKKMVYMERCGGSFFFHVRVRTEIERATVFVIHLTLRHKADSECFTKLKYCDWMNNRQTIPNGTRVTFKDKMLIIQEMLPSGLWRYRFNKCNVIGLEVATQLGEKNFEYYDIQFDDGAIFKGISGYHLD
jgi:hypothetical protein